MKSKAFSSTDYCFASAFELLQRDVAYKQYSCEKWSFNALNRFNCILKTFVCYDKQNISLKKLLKCLHHQYKMCDGNSFKYVTFSPPDPCQMQDNWKLSEGFVAEEAKALLPHRATGRYN